MPDKPRKTAQFKQRRKQAARQRLRDRLSTMPQPLQSDNVAKITKTTSSESQVSVASGFSVRNELFKISILGGSLLVILIVVSLILRYTVTTS